uniref:Uncharacterized protein n=1 Tax=Ditylenchus dipsaci TaxID=166011 RepID=A0A915DM63_9BILA
MVNNYFLAFVIVLTAFLCQFSAGEKNAGVFADKFNPKMRATNMKHATTPDIIQEPTEKISQTPLNAEDIVSDQRKRTADVVQGVVEECTKN